MKNTPKINMDNEAECQNKNTIINAVILFYSIFYNHKKYIIVGFLNTIIGFSVIFICMYQFTFNPIISNILGTSVGLFFSYIYHRIYTFKSQNKKIAEMIRFIFSFFASYTLSLVILYLLLKLSLNSGVSQIISILTYIIVSFIFNNYFVFKKL